MNRDLNRKIATSVEKGDISKTLELIEDAIVSGISAEEILRQVLMPLAHKLALSFRGDGFNIPEVLMVSSALRSGLSAVKSHLNNRKLTKGSVAIGTVRGDVHDIGKQMVSLLLEISGLQITDLGVDVKAETFLEVVRSLRPNILALSSLLTNTMHEMPLIIGALDANGLRPLVKIVVGGGPVSGEFARRIGADGYADDAVDAVKLVHRIIQA